DEFSSSRPCFTTFPCWKLTNFLRKRERLVRRFMTSDGFSSARIHTSLQTRCVGLASGGGSDGRRMVDVGGSVEHRYDGRKGEGRSSFRLALSASPCCCGDRPYNFRHGRRRI
ncbi:hypothetical protein B296_00051689, partial [Ensete ventricosum]